MRSLSSSIGQAQDTARRLIVAIEQKLGELGVSDEAEENFNVSVSFNAGLAALDPACRPSGPARPLLAVLFSQTNLFLNDLIGTFDIAGTKRIHAELSSLVMLGHKLLKTINFETDKIMWAILDRRRPQPSVEDMLRVRPYFLAVHHLWSELARILERLPGNNALKSRILPRAYYEERISEYSGYCQTLREVYAFTVLKVARQEGRFPPRDYLRQVRDRR